MRPIPALAKGRLPPPLAGACILDALCCRIELNPDFLAQKRGAQDEGGPDQREHQHIFDRGNAALVVPELCQKLSSFAHNDNTPE